MVLDRVPQHPRLLALDMTGVTIIDQSGAQMLADLSARMTRRGCGLVLTGLAPALSDQLPPALLRADGIEAARTLTIL